MRTLKPAMLDLNIKCMYWQHTAFLHWGTFYQCPVSLTRNFMISTPSSQDLSRNGWTFLNMVQHQLSCTPSVVSGQKRSLNFIWKAVHCAFASSHTKGDATVTHALSAKFDRGGQWTRKMRCHSVKKSLDLITKAKETCENPISWKNWNQFQIVF